MLVDVAIALFTTAALSIRRTLGFGFSIVFVPLSSLILSYSDAFRVSIVLEFMIGVLLAVELRKSLALRDALWLKGASLLGVTVGIWATRVVSVRTCGLIAMSVVLLFALWLLVTHESYSFAPTHSRIVSAGALSGFLNAWSSLAGPPVVFYYLGTERDVRRFRGALTGYFVLVYAYTFGGLLVARQYDHFHAWGAAEVGVVVIAVISPVLRRFVRRDLQNLMTPALVLLVLGAVAALARLVL